MTPLEGEVVGKTKEGRNIFKNPDGSFSTERTTTIVHPAINGGAPTNIPTIFAGQELTPDEATELIVEIVRRNGSAIDPETGRELVGFPSMKAAVAGAKKRSATIGKELNALTAPRPKIKPTMLGGELPLR